MTTPTNETSRRAKKTYFDDPKFEEVFEKAVKEIEDEKDPLREQLRNCERLTAADYAIRINARG